MSLTKTESALLIGFIAVVSFPILYLARQLDNNSLSSWLWVFNGQSIGTIILFCLLAVIASYLLSRITFFETRPVFWLISLSFLICISLWGEPELLLDSGRYFLQAKQVSEYGVLHFVLQWGDGIQAWTDMPLTPLLYGILFDLFGENRFVIQLFNSLLFSLSTVLTFLSARIIHGKESSFYAGFLLLGMPYLLTQVPLFLVDIHAMFFFSLALYTFLAALSDDGKLKMYWASASIALAMLVKYSTWPMLLILPLLSVSVDPLKTTVRFRRSSFIFFLAALIASIFFIPKRGVIWEQIAILKSYQGPALSEWQESLFSTFLFQVNPLITVFAIIALFVAIRKGNAKVISIGIFTLFFCYHIPRIRYIVPLLPLVTIMAVKGLETLKAQETRRFVCWIAVSSSLIILHQAYLPFFQQTSMTNIKNAGIYIDALESDIVEVTTLPQQQSKAPTHIAIPQLDLFTKKKIIVTQNWPGANNRPHGYHPLLFTWDMKKPSYYNDSRQVQNNKSAPLAVISSSPLDDSLIHTLGGDRAHKMIKRFSANSQIFRYKTFVTVIH